MIFYRLKNHTLCILVLWYFSFVSFFFIFLFFLLFILSQLVGETDFDDVAGDGVDYDGVGEEVVHRGGFCTKRFNCFSVTTVDSFCSIS